MSAYRDALFQAEQKLQSQRRLWLRSEGLHKGLQEMIQDHCIRKHHATVPPDQNMVRFTCLFAQSRATHFAHCISKLHLKFSVWNIKILVLVKLHICVYKSDKRSLTVCMCVCVCSFMTRWRSVCWWLSASDSWIPVAIPTRTSPLFWVWTPNRWWSSCQQRRWVIQIQNRWNDG